MSKHPVKQTVLANGLRVLTIPKQETEAVTVMLFVPVGSRFETASNNGISHFLEHLFFKGTNKRPSTLEISRLLDAIGAEYNAYTSKDHTAYYIKASADHLELMLDLLSDMLFNSLFDPAEIDRERGVIVEELNMYADNPLMHIDTMLEMSVFGKEHPLGYDIGGPKQNIRKIPRSAFMRYKKSHYAPKGMTLVLAGKLHKQHKSWLQKYFSTYRAPFTKVKPKKFVSKQTKPQNLFKIKDTQQSQFALGYPALPYKHALLPALQVMSVILGGNMSSRLFIRLREREGLCYSVHSGADAYTDTGVFAIQAGIDNSRLLPAAKSLGEELQRIKNEQVSAQELEDAVEFIKGQTALRLEDSSSLASWYGKQFTLNGTLVTPEEKIEKLQAVTVKQIQRIANEVLQPSKINLALIGPKHAAQPLIKAIQ